MPNASLSPNIDVVETMDGMRYILHVSRDGASSQSFGFAVITAIPLAAAGLAVRLLWQRFPDVTDLLGALSALFVAQMLFVAKLPWSLFRQRLWQQLVARFGHGEIELRGDQLILGNRVGIIRTIKRRDVGDCQRVVVYTYRSAPETLPAGEATTGTEAAVAPTERTVLAIKTAGSPWLLVDGLTTSETVALAEDLYRRLAALCERIDLPRRVQPPVVIETQENVLYPRIAPDFYLRRKPWWLVLHLAGAIGLAALTLIAYQAGPQFRSMRIAVIFGWLLEILILGVTISLPDDNSAAPPIREEEPQ